MSTAVEATREFAEIEADIARTRASLNRKLQELESRLSPTERLARVKARVNLRRLDPRPHPEWMAVAAVAIGTAMAVAGWRRSRQPALDDGDLEEVVILECDEPTI